MPVDHGIARSIECRMGDPTDPASADMIVTDWSDGFHEERVVLTEPSERQRRLRIRRLKAYVRNATPTAAETVATLKDIIRELGQED